MSDDDDELAELRAQRAAKTGQITLVSSPFHPKLHIFSVKCTSLTHVWSPTELYAAEAGQCSSPRAGSSLSGCK